MTNLINNAVKFTNAGGHIAVAATREASRAAVRVKDDGIGMTPEFVPRVFELFAQADQSLARTRGGLGIGLTVVKHLVERHGGSVEASSAGRGEGSEFIVRLPLAAPERSTPEPPESAAEAPVTANAARRVIVVDDNTDAADSLALMLRLGGHEVRTAYNGEAGLDELRDFAPAVAFLDIGLPGMDGYELVRAHPRGVRRKEPAARRDDRLRHARRSASFARSGLRRAPHQAR